MNELLMNLLVAVIIAIIIVLTKYGITMIQQTVEGTKMDIVLNYAAEFVRAAEQTMSNLTGADKKTWVTELLKDILTAKNISLTDKQIDAIIEAAVFNMNVETNQMTKEE